MEDSEHVHHFTGRFRKFDKIVHAGEMKFDDLLLHFTDKVRIDFKNILANV